MSTLTYRVLQATGGSVEAPVLISPVPFSARYDLDRTTGVISRTGHPLRGRSIAGKILVSPGVQGGVAAGWALLAMQGYEVCPAGLVFGDTNPVMVQGAVTAQLPIAAGVEPSIFDELQTDDVVFFDSEALTVTLSRRANNQG